MRKSFAQWGKVLEILKEEAVRLKVNNTRLRAFKAGGHAGKGSYVDQFLEDKDRLALSLASKRDLENQQGLLFARLRKKALELPIRTLHGHTFFVKSLAVLRPLSIILFRKLVFDKTSNIADFIFSKSVLSIIKGGNYD